MAEHYARGRQQLYIEHLAVGRIAGSGIEHGGAEPYGLALEVGGVVEVQVRLLLRAQAVEVVDVRSLHEDGLGLPVQGRLLIFLRVGSTGYTPKQQTNDVKTLDRHISLLFFYSIHLDGYIFCF